MSDNGNDDDPKERTQAIALSDLLKLASPERRKVKATLTCIAGRAAGRTYVLDLIETVLGRVAEKVDIVVDDEGVSRKHAEICEVDGAHSLRDLGSTNGTICNGTRILEPTLLHDGDRIRIGATAVYKFGYQDELEEQMQARLYDSATRDALTQAYNRRYFNERLASEWAWSERHKMPCAIIGIDADHFKRINDGYGHPAGDLVLKELVATIHGVVRKEDIVARVGGEEFLVLARATTRPQATVLAERIRVAVEARSILFGATPLTITVSLGVATSNDVGISSPDELVSRADEFLYRAKQNGRNRVEPPPK